MKRIWMCYLCMMYISLSYAQQIEFRQLSWEEAKIIAGEEKKGIFVDVYTTWCGPCRKMSANVFTDERVGKWFNEHYVSLRLDAEKQADHGFFKEYRADSYPAFFWFDEKGKLQDSKGGYMDAEAFLNTAKKAEESTLAAEWEDCRKRWETGQRDEAFVRRYLFDILPQVRPGDVRPLLNEYLASLDKDRLATESTARMVGGFSRNLVDDLAFRTLLRYNDVYQQMLGVHDFGKRLYMILVRVPMADRNDSVRFTEDLRIINSIEFPNKVMYQSLLNMEKMLFDKKYEEGLKEAEHIMELYGKDFPYLYSEICYTLIISGFFLDETSLADGEKDKAIMLARKAFDIMPSQCTLAYLAAAYAKKGDYKKSYELIMHLPFFSEPTLSNAVYPMLNLPMKKEL